MKTETQSSFLPPWTEPLTRLLPGSRGGPVILMYHQIADLRHDQWALAVSPRHFAEHMQVLTRLRQPVSLTQLVDDRGGAQQALQVAVTFDDGYLDNLVQAKPILEQHAVPATVFVVAAAVGHDREFWWDELDRLLLDEQPLPAELRLRLAGREHHWTLRPDDRSDPFFARRGASRTRLHRQLWRRLRALPAPEREEALASIRAWSGRPTAVRPDRRVMTADEVRHLAEGGLVEIGAHTASHPRLSALPYADQLEDMVSGKRQLEEMISRQVTSFSYPFGGYLDVASSTISAARNAGFARACTTRKGTVGPATNPLLLPRLYVADWSGDEFERWLRTWQ